MSGVAALAASLPTLISEQHVEDIVHIPESTAALAGETFTEPRLVQQIALRGLLLRFAMRGLNASEASEAAKVPYQTVRTIYADPEFKHEVRRRIDSAFGDADDEFFANKLTLAERIRDKGNDAFRVLCEMLDDPATHPGYRMRIAQDILDRNEQTQAGFTTRRLIDTDQLRLAAQTAIEMEKR